MTASGSKSTPAVGFLTVCRHRELGLFGGLLLLNQGGRPLEFHCTAPVKPNRAQEILYGPTLEPYLYGEQIAHTLIGKAKATPGLVFTDREPVLAVRELVDIPVALVDCGIRADESADGSDGDFRRVDGPHTQASSAPHLLTSFQHGRHGLSVARTHAADQAAIERRCQSLAADFDLSEPFTRIREAIQEAQRASR